MWERRQGDLYHGGRNFTEGGYHLPSRRWSACCRICKIDSRTLDKRENQNQSDQMKKSFLSGPLAGAAFLMATSAIGPGFITQTTKFTEQLKGSFGFVIFISVLLDIGVQLNIWRLVSVSKMYAQDLANSMLPGAGYFLTALILLGGLAFNIGNIAGAGLGFQVLFGWSVQTGAMVNCIIAAIIFLVKEVGKAMDVFAKTLGFVMIALTLYVAFQANLPLAE